MNLFSKGIRILNIVSILVILFFAACDDDTTTTTADDETTTTDDDSSSSVSNDDYTLGLLLNTEDASDGYTLFAPLGSTTTYLIDNCGYLVQSWDSDYKPGQSVYMLENGYLLRTGKYGNLTFADGGGVGGIIEMIDSEGTVAWSYTLSSGFECQHHDIEYLDNGNILIISWDKKTEVEASLAGRTTSGDYLWSEKIVEIEPDIESGTAEIIWEWYVWDHLVQDENSDKSNYATVGDHPELIDLNYTYDGDEEEDWLHINSIDYNEDLDQIVLSCHNFSEIWIIDHSTTTEEAATHEGGDQGMGGDIIYRWGNPQAYDQGDDDDQQLFVQHNANWIDDSYTDGGKIMVFNNQAGNAVDEDYSAIDVIDTDVNDDGSYSLSDNTYAPTEPSWTYTAADPTDFYATNISGATRLSNGNTLICEATSGYFFEVDYDGDIVWEYVNPVSASGIIDQYSTASNNKVFRAERYATDFAGFDDYDLTSSGTIEDGSDYSCDL
jgi:hypothetical protein